MRISLLNRLELIQNLIRFACADLSVNYNVGVVVPSGDDAKKFTRDFNIELDTVPKWMRPKLFSSSMRRIEFDNHFHIYLLYGDYASKGRSLNHIFASSRMTPEELAPHCFTVLTNGFETFNDE